MIDRDKFGKRVCILRKRMGLSQAQLAEKLNITTQAVSKWECGTALPDIDILLELSWLFEIPINSLLDDSGDFANSNAIIRSNIPESAEKIIKTKGQRNFIASLSPYFNEDELIRLTKSIADKNLEVNFNITVRDKTNEYENHSSIPLSAVSENTLRELAPVISDTIGGAVGKIDCGLQRISEIMICPACKGKLTIHKDNDAICLECDKGHKYYVDDGVVYFNTREIPGELWSLYFRNYNHYLKEASAPTLPVYNRGKVFDEELKWKEIEKRRPRIILDIASGTGYGIKYTLERIYWNCTVILTDLSHRILAWNRKYILENLSNPYVNVVYIACDCANMPFKDNSIDCITSNGGFESMQAKTIAGFHDAYRILRSKGYAIYDMSLVEDYESQNTRKWIELYNSIEDNEDGEKSRKMRDAKKWLDICKDTGYSDTQGVKVYGELPAPDSDTFPYENMVLRWMCCYVFVSVK